MLSELIPVVYYSFFHTLTPGHSKTLLLAAVIAGKQRSALVRYTLGFSLAHGLAMVLAVAAGFLFKSVLINLSGNHPHLVVGVSIFVLALAGAYFALESLRIYKLGLREEPENIPAGFFDRRPFVTGLLVGVMPCPDIIGIGLVVPNLTIGRGLLVPSLLAVWLTVSASICALGLALTLLPIQRSARSLRLPEWFPAAASAGICGVVIAYRLAGMS